MKIIIIKLGALGDVINTFPLVVALKENLDAEIHWLVAPLSYPLVRNHSCVDKAIVFDKKKGKRGITAAIKALRETQYDIAFDLQRILKSGFFCMAAKSKRRLGFNKERCKEQSWIFPFERILPSNPQAHMLIQYLEFAEHLNISCGTPTWKIPRSNCPLPVLLPHDFLVLNIGATKPANRWANDNFAILAEEASKTFGLVPVLTGGPEDMENARRIKETSRTDILDLTGKTTIPELVEVLGRARCVISCDTGPMHLACALGTRLIALFGPSNPGRTGPFKGRVIQKPQACTPCNKKHCKNPLCMEAITPEDVMEAISFQIRECTDDNG
ncbi:RfaF [Desulforapulum autotrophicum HRM2]|uniref:RfaF n=1 Tax=Desulforapulum autotrophicum (strain ATCC 43914 / DSM 3382 / VKM B-1955 / HRM2) TaxID=177437 RepID=C0QBS0_DESAH|nr:glycosyltransferase family 9 protein [Desulforapulum autotrophicum]ACN14932.1 RfaF [Desulforapulum autotrophicum HRM2]